MRRMEDKKQLLDVILKFAQKKFVSTGEEEQVIGSNKYFKNFVNVRWNEIITKYGAKDISIYGGDGTLQTRLKFPDVRGTITLGSYIKVEGRSVRRTGDTTYFVPIHTDNLYDELIKYVNEDIPLPVVVLHLQYFVDTYITPDYDIYIRLTNYQIQDDDESTEEEDKLIILEGEFMRIRRPWSIDIGRIHCEYRKSGEFCWLDINEFTPPATNKTITKNKRRK